MMTASPLTIVLVAVVGLLSIGLYGLLITRNLIKVVIALQVLVKAAVLAIVVAGQASGRLEVGQSLAATVIVADTMVAVVGLALAIQIQRRFGSLDVSAMSTLRG
jgi:NADH:ubiquinone oxidoreductase subunit K